MSSGFDLKGVQKKLRRYEALVGVCVRFFEANVSHITFAGRGEVGGAGKEGRG